jgi:ribosome biogenesis GTPase
LTRIAAGIEARRQLIASNVDTLFIAMSCNDDFNLSRLERYLAIAHQAAVTPVVVLTKADACGELTQRIADAQEAAALATVVAIDARDRACVQSLAPWLDAGQTVAFVGSSGVGKSTLINTLLGIERQATAAIREDDSKGRHTTTSRQLVQMPGGAWVIDTPGMRELKIGEASAGLQATFEDIEQLAANCKFRDCSHRMEMGCAVIAAVREGRLDARRIDNYRKLQREAAHASASLAERRERDRQFGRMRHEMERVRKKGKIPPP